MDGGQPNDRPRSEGGGTRIQRSLLLTGTALFLVGIATLLGTGGADVDPDAGQDAVAVGDAGDARERSPTPADAGTPAAPDGDDPVITTATGEDANAGAQTATPPEDGERTATPSPTGNDDSILDGILG